MTSSLASRNGFSGVSRSRCESVFESVILRFTAAFHGGLLLLFSVLSLPAFNAQVDLHPLVVLLQDAIILAQRMPLPALGKQNALHVGMPVEFNSKHVVHFALQPVRRRPNGHGTRQSLAIHNPRSHADALVARERIKQQRS